MRKDVNHPSVILYSIGNEVPDGSTPVGLHLGRALADKVRALDDTRFVTQAVTGLLVGGPELFDDIRDAATATGTDEDTGINTATMNLADYMVHGDAVARRRRTRRVRRSRTSTSPGTTTWRPASSSTASSSRNG